MTLLPRYADHAHILGFDAEVKRFLLSVLLISRYNLANRPASPANQQYTRRIVASSDALLRLLRAPEWPKLDPETEAGIAELRLLETLARPTGEDVEEELVTLSERRFVALSPPWSRLSPSSGLTLAAWPAPRRILFSVGPNIGIGDEMILIEVVRRLAQAFPAATLEVVSYYPTLWNLVPEATLRSSPEEGDQLWAYAHAARLLREDPTALVIFAEFAADPIYRHLERVSTMKRFVYIDSGSRLARLVDQTRGLTAEYDASSDARVYDAVGGLLTQIGLPNGAAKANATADPRAGILGSGPTANVGGLGTGGAHLVPELPRPRPRRSPGVVFVNPFSSKDYRKLRPAWWACALRTAARAVPVEVSVFAGIHEECWEYARAIVDEASGECVRARILGDGTVPTIEEVLRAAAASDVVFGLDTFTAHIGVFAPVPCVTVFFGLGWWDGWRVDSNHVLNARIYGEPESVGRLVGRFLAPSEARSSAVAIVDETRSLAAVLATASPAEIVSGIDRIVAVLAAWAASDPALARDFSDTPVEFARDLRAALAHTTTRDAATAALLSRALNTWTESNLFRYARYLAA